ncbi:MAG: polysaccharide deacetylase family protein [bacterium]
MMFRSKRSLALLFTALLLFASSPLNAADTNYLVVLTYHRFDTNSWISTPLDQFSQQMDYLREYNYNIMTAEEVKEHLKTGKMFPEKSVLITIDDGYRSVDYNGYPYLKKHNIPAVINIYPKAQETGYSAYINWDTVAKMARNPLIHIGNHSYSHRGLLRHKHDSEALRKEVTQAQKLIKKHTGQSPLVFTLPYGIYDSELIAKIQEMDSAPPLIFSTLPGVTAAVDSRQPYRRFMIDSHTTMHDFISILHRKPLKLDISLPDGVDLKPDSEPIIFQLKHGDRLDTGNLYVFLNGQNMAAHFSSTLTKNEYQLFIPEKISSSWNQLMILALDKKERIYRMYSTAFSHKKTKPGKTSKRENNASQTKQTLSP